MEAELQSNHNQLSTPDAKKTAMYVRITACLLESN